MTDVDGEYQLRGPSWMRMRSERALATSRPEERDDREPDVDALT